MYGSLRPSFDIVVLITLTRLLMNPPERETLLAFLASCVCNTEMARSHMAADGINWSILESHSLYFPWLLITGFTLAGY